MNKREQAAVAAVEAAQANLAAIRQDLATRDVRPEFQRAVALYGRGYRVEGWGLILTDTYNETRFWRAGHAPLTRMVTWSNGETSPSSVGYYADGTDRRTEQVPEYLAAHEADLGDEDAMWVALPYLDDLTAEGV